MVTIPAEKSHPWLDLFILLAFGPEAGFALHNAFRDGLSIESLTSFAKTCEVLSGHKLGSESVKWIDRGQNRYCLQVNQTSLDYDAAKQQLWTIPLEIIRLLNEQLPDREKQLEAISLLPIYGETFVFYLSKLQKRILEEERGWIFFDTRFLAGANDA